MISHFYLSPESKAVETIAEGVICTSPGGELSGFGYEQVTGDDGFSIEED